MLRVAVVFFTVLAIHSAVADPQVNLLLLFSKTGARNFYKNQQLDFF